MTALHNTETTQELRLWERLQNILTCNDQNREIVSRMLKDRKYVNAQFLQQLEDNANSIRNLVNETRFRKRRKNDNKKIDRLT